MADSWKLTADLKLKQHRMSHHKPSILLELGILRVKFDRLE
jgi:hypothetical protein